MSTNAKVSVTLEINAKSCWSDETSVAQVKKQAVDDAIQELNRLANDANYRIKLIGDPKVTVVTFDA